MHGVSWQADGIEGSFVCPFRHAPHVICPCQSILATACVVGEMKNKPDLLACYICLILQLPASSMVPAAHQELPAHYVCLGR